MNALLLGGACLGALVTFLMADPDQIPDPLDIAEHQVSQDLGSMTTTVEVDTATGEVTETRVIAFLD